MAKRNRKPLQCAHCGQPFPRVACAGLFCGDDCRNEHQVQMESACCALKEAGFEQHPEVTNLWVKDGHAISAEQVKKIGIEKAVTIHARHVAGAQLA